MIQIRNINLSFGDQILFDNISFTVSYNQKIGLVGRNGAGKSTLLKIIAKQQTLDGGKVAVEKGSRIAYLPQEVVLMSQRSVIDETLSVFQDLFVLQQECSEIETALDAGTADDEMLERYSHIQSELTELDGDRVLIKVKKVLTGLGFDIQKQAMSVDQLSTGWKMRVVLAKLLLTDAEFYLFDEPTNHLDIVAKDWFAEFLQNSSKGFLLVTHDRYFLDKVCSEIIELDRGKAKRYQGNYSFFIEQKEIEEVLLNKKYQEQQREIKRKKATAERFRAKASKAKMAQSMFRELEKMELIEPPQQHKEVRISFNEIQRSGKVVLTVEGISSGYGEKTILRDISLLVERGEKVGLVAANGVGKTTLFKTLIKQLPCKTGFVELGHNVAMTYFEQDQEKVLKPENTILKEVEDACPNAETRKRVRTLLGTFLFPGDDVLKKIRVLSGGERNRVAMVKVLLQDANFLLLDEPTNHLDLQSKSILLSALQHYQGTVFFVSHDRTFLENLATRIIELTPQGAISYPGDYDSYLYHKKSLQKQTETKNYQKNSKQKKEKTKNGLGYQDRKKLKKLESKISRTEKELAREQKSFANLEYGSHEFEEAVGRVKKGEEVLEALMKKWEELSA